MCPTRDVRSRRADVLEVCWASATDTDEGGSSNLPLTHWQPVEHVAEDWSDVLKFPGTDDKPGSSVQDHL